jgi:uncharacterized protein involved in outer membrane biogenesis
MSDRPNPGTAAHARSHAREAQVTGAARRRPRRWVIVAGLIAAVFVVVLLIWDWNWFKPMVERRVEAATGRDFAINGDLDVDLFPIVVRADGVRLSNAQWSTQGDEMFSAGRVEIGIRFWPLLVGRIDLPLVGVDQGRILLERNADGAANWQFSDEPAERDGTPPIIRDLAVTDTRLRLIEVNLRTDLRLDLRTGDPVDGERAALLANGEGRYRGEPFELSGRVDSPLDLQDGDQPYRIDVRASAGNTRAHARGDLVAPLQFTDFAVRFELSGADLAHLYPLLGVALPTTPPYSLDGQLSRDGLVWRYEKFAGTVGDSDLGGDVSIDPGGERITLIAVLESSRLDLDDLAGFLGGTPGTGADETASGQQVAEKAEQEASGRLLPDKPYDLSKLRSLDADVTLTAAEVNAPPLPVRSLAGHLVLEDGLVTIDPLKLGVAGGEMNTWITMDATRDPIATTLRLQARGLDLPQLFPNAELVRDSVGRIAGNADLSARGNSVALMLGSADGELGLAMGRGRISALLIELAGLDIAEAIRFLLTDDEVIPVRCAYADFAFADGVATARAFAVDTTDTVIFGEGSIDFGEEALDIRLRPQPKDRSILALRTPLRIGGTLADPSFRPEGGPLLLRGIAAAVLYAAAPPAALLALIEFGPGEDAECGPSPEDPAS